MRWTVILLVWMLGLVLHAQDDTAASKDGNPVDNPLLKLLFDDDQGERKSGSIDADTVKRDAKRRGQVLEELGAGRIRTANDHYHAAMVFQHGESADEIRLAFSLAWISAQMDSKNKDRALWLSAAAWDRIMMRLQKPQWYGTQYVADDANSEFRLYRIDEDAATDQERIRFNVPILKDAKKRVEILNQHLRQKSDEPSHAPEPAAGPDARGESSPRAR